MQGSWCLAILAAFWLFFDASFLDDNRGALLSAGFLQAVVSLLEGYARLMPPPPQTEPLPLSIDHLKVVRTAIGGTSQC